MNQIIIAGEAAGDILAADEGLSFWGGVNPQNGIVQDAHHPWHQRSLANKVLMFPTSRGSCSGSGVLLELIQNGHAPVALIFKESESILTLGVIVAMHVFNLSIPVLRLNSDDFEKVARKNSAVIKGDRIIAEDMEVILTSSSRVGLDLSKRDQAMLDGVNGPAVQTAMKILCDVAKLEHASCFIDVSKVHIDGCIYACDALLKFAEFFEGLGAQVSIPTTMNSISVDYNNWQRQGVNQEFGKAAQRLADAYVNMGAAPSFTCAPYLLEDAPILEENIAWAESNAVIYANSVLGARTAKHPDFLDLCIALTGRSPRLGMYQEGHRTARRILNVAFFDKVDDSFWPMLGYLAGTYAPDCIPLIRGVSHLAPSNDDLKALCGAFGTTSGSPMLHIAGVTPEAENFSSDAVEVEITKHDFQHIWMQFNPSCQPIELVALGSPHFSIGECEKLVTLLDDVVRKDSVIGMITMGQGGLNKIKENGVLEKLNKAGFKVHPDLCWCSVTEPVFPEGTNTLMTNSGKYAHYGPGLTGREIRFGSLEQCVESFVSGYSPSSQPCWLEN